MAERSYDFLMPSVNFFGPGVISKIGDRAKMLGMKKPVIVTDKFLEGLKDGAVEQTLDSLKAAGVDYVVYNNVEPNPKIRNIKEVKKLYEESGADSIITVGGGSAHDTGKGAGIILTNGDDITKLAGIETLDKALPPLIAVNTTAGTGSELTRHAVITNEETHLKFVVVSWRNIPLVSFNDPTLMLDVPKGLTAATGMDAFVQAVEPYVSVDHNPITDSQCVEAIKLIETSLREAVANGHNLDARTKMVEAEMLAGMAFNNRQLAYPFMPWLTNSVVNTTHLMVFAVPYFYLTLKNITLLLAQIVSPNWLKSWVKTLKAYQRGMLPKNSTIKAMKQLSRRRWYSSLNQRNWC